MTLSRKILLLTASCLLLTAVPLSAKKKDGPRPLRFPFALTPGMAPDPVKAVLIQKGLVYIQEKESEGERSVLWKLNGQIQEGLFVPTRVSILFVKEKLSSIAFSMAGIPECGLAQSAFASALQFSRLNYDPKEAPITEEPPVDTIDCGPHAAASDWHLRRENKKLVLITDATLTPRGYEVNVTYYDRPTMKPKTDETDPAKKESSKTTQENL